MIGNHLLEYRQMKDHQERLLSEGQRLQEAHAARNGKHTTDRTHTSRSATRTGVVDRLRSPSAAERLWATPGASIPAKRRRHHLPTLVELERALVNRLSADACRRARRLARQRAIARFSRTHSLWYQSLFDSRSLRALPDEFFKRSAESVARSWAAQFPYYREASRDRDVARLEPVAKDFLQMLAEEERRLAVGATC